LESLGRKIYGADGLKSVVRTMKVLAASNIIQYEKAVSSLSEYYNTVEMGLFVCLFVCLFPCTEHVQNRWQAKMPAVLLPCNGL